FVAAVRLAGEVERIVPNEPRLTKLWPEMSRFFDIETEPAGADVFAKEYADANAPWIHVGRSPLHRLRLPTAFFRWRVTKDGFAPLEAAPSIDEGAPSVVSRAPPRSLGKLGNLKFTLAREGELPPRMIRVRGGTVSLHFPGLQTLPDLQLPDFLLDQY